MIGKPVVQNTCIRDRPNLAIYVLQTLIYHLSCDFSNLNLHNFDFLKFHFISDFFQFISFSIFFSISIDLIFGKGKMFWTLKTLNTKQKWLNLWVIKIYLTLASLFCCFYGSNFWHWQLCTRTGFYTPSEMDKKLFTGGIVFCQMWCDFQHLDIFLCENYTKKLINKKVINKLNHWWPNVKFSIWTNSIWLCW